MTCVLELILLDSSEQRKAIQCLDKASWQHLITQPFPLPLLTHEPGRKGNKLCSSIWSQQDHPTLHLTSAGVEEEERREVGGEKTSLPIIVFHAAEQLLKIIGWTYNPNFVCVKIIGLVGLFSLFFQ